MVPSIESSGTVLLGGKSFSNARLRVCIRRAPANAALRIIAALLESQDIQYAAFA
jgi:hypothetical protein